jgi:hypothetical protein
MKSTSRIKNDEDDLDLDLSPFNDGMKVQNEFPSYP